MIDELTQTIDTLTDSMKKMDSKLLVLKSKMSEKDLIKINKFEEELQKSSKNGDMAEMINIINIFAKTK